MPYRISKTIELQSGHMLSKHPGHCKYPHGHTRQVEIVLEAEQLDANDMVCDFTVIKEALADFMERMDHALCMNTDDPMFATLKMAYGARVIPFEHRDPTTEIIAQMVFDVVKKSLAEYAARPNTPFVVARGVRLARVRVWETSTAWAEYME